MRLNTKIMLMLIPMMLIPIIIIAAFSFTAQNDYAAEVNRRQIFDRLSNVNTHNHTFRDSVRSNLNLFSNDKLIQKYVTLDEELRYDLLSPVILRLLKSYQESFPDYYEIRIIFPDGFEDVRITNRDIPNISEEEASHQVIGELLKNEIRAYSYFGINPDNEELSYFEFNPLVVRDKSIDGLSALAKFRAYLSLSVSIGWLEKIVLDSELSGNGFLFISNKAGNVMMAANKQSLLAKNINIYDIFATDKQSRLQLSRLLDDEELAPKRSPNQFSVGNASGYLWTLPISNELTLMTWAPSDALIEKTRRLALVVTSVSLIAVILITLLLYAILARLIVLPIQRLEKAAKQIGKNENNDEGPVIDINGNDEISSLANALVNMNNSLLESNNQIKYLAYYDDLTGLPNRILFNEMLSKAIAGTKRHNRTHAVLFLDLDDFKRVNDTVGHKLGDYFLKQIANRVNDCLRETDYVTRVEQEKQDDIAARVGGDEFLLLLHDIPDIFVPSKVASRIIEKLSEPVMVNNIEFFVGASIGISIYPNDAESIEDLIKYADMAMYHAKNMGKNSFQYYTKKMNSILSDRLNIENKLRQAIKNKDIFLHYQPIFDLQTREIVALEALVRWNDPIDGLIEPDIFVPIAEETGLISQIDDWVLDEACRQAKNWQLQGMKPLSISVNCSAAQLCRTNLPTLIEKVLDNTGLDAKYLHIEITETAIMEDVKRVTGILAGIRKLGVSVSLDDFGTGYSSLSYLRQFPIDILKIDRSFIHEICGSSEGKAIIVSAIINMAHALNLKVVAEGVETEAQLEYLIKWRCDFVQGFYLSEPMSVVETEALLANPHLKTGIDNLTL